MDANELGRREIGSRCLDGESVEGDKVVKYTEGDSSYSGEHEFRKWADEKDFLGTTLMDDPINQSQKSSKKLMMTMQIFGENI
ncbi:hypothetical protein HNY73_022939 [Argiope bruennichi]|uniref:Uncharacterized protein n=1 Tax=Argiope bruennichi TaxID=94029 RepID=A0A8T0E279_ARGBR|nr:hypothetical protein HNY73_022939 [Argiope bruennichi]